MFDYEHQEFEVSYTKSQKIVREKKNYLLLGVGPPWRVGPIDLVIPVSIVV